MITYVAQPNPFWYFSDSIGNPLSGGMIYSYSSLTTLPKPIFQDSNGANAYPNPFLFDMTAQGGPFYFKIDSTAPTDLYLLIIKDSDGVTVKTINNFPIGGGGGGGGGITNNPASNYILNNQFWHNIGASTGSTVGTVTTLAPSAHDAFNGSSNALPDLTFIKETADGTDVVSFVPFLGSGASLAPTEITPEYYFNYTCSVLGTGNKYLQIPITPKIINLSATAVSFIFWGRSSTSDTINVYSWQFTGDGGSPTPSPVTTTSFGGSPITLTPTWAQYVISDTLPNTNALVRGTCGNDALFFQIQMQLSGTCNIDIAKPALRLGTANPLPTFESVDQIDSLVNSPRTGDIRTSINNFNPYGWVMANDGTIGSSSSSSTTRANIDTFPLYNLIWNTVPDSLAPVTGGRGGSAIVDFSANKPLALTKMLGRVVAGTVNTSATPNALSTTFTVTGSPTTIATLGVALPGLFLGVPIKIFGAVSLPLVNGNTYYVIPTGTPTIIQLATSAENAIAGAPITFTTDSSATLVYPAHQLGIYLGEETHTMTTAELVAHNHAVLGTPGGGAATGGLPILSQTATVTEVTGSSVPFNVFQPTAFYNVFFKL